MSKSLKPCPFCKTRNNLYALCEEYLPSSVPIFGWCIKCRNCGARGPIAITEKAAGKAWDAREEES